MEGMICSMTFAERKKPQILNASRRKRIAKGSGVSVTELNTLLNRFSQMQQMMRKMGKFQKMELTRDMVVEDKSLHGGQLQVRQEFIVNYSKDTPTPKRYELFNWNVYPDDKFKLWSYINSKGDD